MSIQFKTGDTVRVLDSLTGRKEDVGKVFTIIAIDKPLFQVSNEYWYNPQYLELVEETHQEALERLQLKVGDKVKVLCKAEGYERGWGNSWNYLMDGYIGETLNVKLISTVGEGVQLSNGGYYFPAFVLEKVIEKEEVMETPVSLTDCIQFPDTDAIQGKEESSTPTDTILDKAKSLIYGDRQKEYGSATKNFGDVAKMWSILLGKEITPYQVIQCMIALKQCRLINQPEHLDSYIDICGYVGCFEKIKNGI